jgi:putative transport protein
MSAANAVEFLRGQPVIVLFLLLGCGYLLGRIKVAGFACGPIAGTLLISLVLGSYGFRISAGVQAVGFSLFIFSVGYKAGPRFFGVLKAQGLQYLALALFVVTVGFLTTWLAGAVLRLPPGGNAGILAGSLTSSPTLAAAQDAVHSGLVALPAGWTEERVLASIGAGYAITYVIGTIGIVALINLFPRVIGLDLEAEARALEQSSQPDLLEPLQARAYRVESQEFCRPTMAELSARLWDGLAMVRVRRALEWIRPAAHEHLRIGDEIYAYGSAKFFRGGIEGAGPEIPVIAEMELSASQTRVVVARPEAVGRTLHALNLAGSYGLVVYEVKRDGLPLPVTRDLALQRGDILTVVGPVLGIKALPQTLGPVEPNPVETDMTTFAFGIALGAALGLPAITVGAVPLSLGAAGGLLLVGLLAGWLNSTRPTVARFPDAARWVFMEFGLLIFIAGVGLNAGSGIFDTLRDTGAALVLAAMCVVTLPLALGYVFGRRVLKLEPVVLLGALSGAMTSPPALTLITREANSSVPTLGYTGTYAFASILLTVAGTLIMHL